MNLEELTDEHLEIGRKAVEDALIDMRDSRISILGRNNGLVCKEKDGTPSHIIRMGFEQAMAIAVKAILEKLK